jgi:hypothetical protein
MSNRIETRSGVFIDPTDIDERLVNIEDIAFTAARVPRFSGWANFTVGEHCLEVQQILLELGEPPLLQLQGVLHDSAELLGLLDFAKPVKRRLPEYSRIEEVTLKRIFAGLRIPFPGDDANKRIKYADTLSLILEARRDLPSGARAMPAREEWSWVDQDWELAACEVANVVDDVLLRVARLERTEDLSRQGAIRALFLRQYEELRREVNA